MYKYIINPATGRKVKLNGRIGKQILRNYILYLDKQTGGMKWKPFVMGAAAAALGTSGANQPSDGTGYNTVGSAIGMSDTHQPSYGTYDMDSLPSTELGYQPSTYAYGTVVGSYDSYDNPYNTYSVPSTAPSITKEDIISFVDELIPISSSNSVSIKRKISNINFEMPKEGEKSILDQLKQLVKSIMEIRGAKDKSNVLKQFKGVLDKEIKWLAKKYVDQFEIIEERAFEKFAFINNIDKLSKRPELYLPNFGPGSPSHITSEKYILNSFLMETSILIREKFPRKQFAFIYANFFPEEEMEFLLDFSYYDENGNVLNNNTKKKMKQERLEKLIKETPNPTLRSLKQIVHEMQKHMNFSGMGHATSVATQLFKQILGK